MAASKLAMLSGKGGSGKTTLSLMLAKTMSAAGLKTLLVDCDMATHGLTYFFEGDLNKQVLSLVECVDLFHTESAAKENCESHFKSMSTSPLSVDDMCELIPSIVHVSDNAEFEFADCLGAIQWIAEHYAASFDVIIFDGQAGYSPFVQAIANVSDVILFVMELDSISVSATRVLYRRLCNGNDAAIDEHNLYQVINKLDEEDRETFAKVVTGTMFENLPPLRFDWSIRRAFAECRIPNMASTHIELLYSVTRIISQLFPKFRKPLNKYVREQSLAYEESLCLEIRAVRHDLFISVLNFTSLLLSIPSMLLSIGSLGLILDNHAKMTVSELKYPLIILLFFIALSVLLIYVYTKTSREDGFLNRINKRKKEIRSKIKELREQRNEYT